MLNKIKIGIVGCGAIGSSLAKTVSSQLSKNADLVAFYDFDSAKALKLAKALGVKTNSVVNNLDSLINRSDLVIEAASAVSSWDIARKSLNKARSVMIMSVGGVIERVAQLNKLAQKHNAHVYIPSGAIAGIDALKAAASGNINKVTLTTYKNPQAFKGVKFIENSGIKLANIKSDKILYSGPAVMAVKLFPQNINVAAVLSMAGIGAKKTIIKIVASPKANRNIHQIEIESSAGKITTRTENVLHPENPKTSYLAVLAAVATLKQILVPVKIGT